MSKIDSSYTTLAATSVMYIKYNPSSHVENRLKLYDPGGNIYY